MAFPGKLYISCGGRGANDVDAVVGGDDAATVAETQDTECFPFKPSLSLILLLGDEPVAAHPSFGEDFCCPVEKKVDIVCFLLLVNEAASLLPPVMLADIRWAIFVAASC